MILRNHKCLNWLISAALSLEEHHYSCDDFQWILFHFGWYFGGEIIFHFSANVNASYGIATESLWSGTSCNSWRMRILTWTMYVGVIHEALEHEYLHCFGSAYSLAIHVVVGCFFEAIVFSIFWMVHVTIPFPSSIFLDPFADFYSKSSLWRHPTCALCAFMCVVYLCACVFVYICLCVFVRASMKYYPCLRHVSCKPNTGDKSNRKSQFADNLTELPIRWSLMNICVIHIYYLLVICGIIWIGKEIAKAHAVSIVVMRFFIYARLREWLIEKF